MKTYGKLSLVDGGQTWCIDQLEPHARIKLKTIFTKIKISKQPPYLFPNTLNNAADLFWFMQRYGLEISSADQRKLVRQKNKFNHRALELTELVQKGNYPKIEAILKDKNQFREHQAQAISLATKVKGLLVGDDVGLGKTWCGFGLGFEENTLPIAIIVEPHLQKQWVNKIKEITHISVHSIDVTKPYKLPDASIYVFRYSQLGGWADVFSTGFFNSVVYDEIQNLRTGSETSKGCGAKILSDNVTFRMGLSATPIYGYGIEIWNIYQFLDPEILGTKEEFVREWCFGNDKIVKDPEALGAFLRENHCFVRRTKGDVGQKDDNVHSYIQLIDHDEKIVKDTEQLAIELALTTLKGSFVEQGRAAREFDLRMREMTGIAKAKNVAAFVKILVESGEKVLLAGWHREVYNIWKKEFGKAGIKFCMYTGSESPSQKTFSKQSFMDDQADVMIISLRSGSGMDGIQKHCSYVVFGELDWSGEVHKQVIGRLDRELQLKLVTAIYMVTEFGSDPSMQDIIAVKSDQARGINDPAEDLKEIINDPQKIKNLAKKFLLSKGVNIEKSQAAI